MDDKDIVSAVRNALVGRVGSETFEIWFGTQPAWEWTGSQLRIMASDPFRLDRLRNTLREDIRVACQVATGRALPVQFVLAERPPNVPTGQAATTAAASISSGREMISLGHRANTPPRSERSNAATAARADRSTSARVNPEPPARAPRNWDSLVVGESNRVAVAAVEQILARPGSVFPLFIHGPHGSGKTHLVESLLAQVRRDRNVRRAVYLSAEQFTGQFLEALRGSGMPSFRNKYRAVDLLVIDDAQFFVGKNATAIELQYTLDTLQRGHRQLVLTSDRPPSELAGLGSDLVARLSGGLVCPLELPSREMRVEIIRRAAKRLELTLPVDVVELLGEQLTGDVRFIHGALNRLQAASAVHRKAVTVDFAMTALSDLLRATRRVVRLADIERAVCDVFGIDSRSLQSDCKVRTVSQPRMLAMWLARKYTRAALSEIGQYFGGRSHTSVISAQRKIERLLSSRTPPVVNQLECNLADAVRRVEAQLRTGT